MKEVQAFGYWNAVIIAVIVIAILTAGYFMWKNRRR